MLRRSVTLTDIIVWIVVICTLVGLMIMANGCDGDPQSPNANYCGDDSLDVEMYHADGVPDWTYDYWDVLDDQVGEHVYGVDAGWCITIAENGVDVGGIRVDARVDEHLDPLGGDYDIWDDTAPNGKEYGFIHPVGCGGEWITTDDLGSGRTDPMGQLFILIGYGDPYTGTMFRNEAGYELPRGADMISSVVNFSFIMPKRLGNKLLSEGNQTLFRPQYGDIGDILNNSMQAMGHYTGVKSYTIGDTTVTIAPATPEQIQQAHNTNYSKDGYEITPHPLSKNVVVHDVNDLYSVIDEDFGIWKFSPSLGWWTDWAMGDYNSIDEIIPLWLADANDANDLLNLTYMCRYYLYYTYVWVKDVELVKADYSTSLLLSKDANDVTVDSTPLPLGRWYSWPSGIELKSMYILPLTDTGVTGLYYDYSGCPVIVVHMADGGHFEVVPDTFYGDWDWDGAVTFFDYNMLLAQMGKDLWTDEGVDLWYDSFPQDGVIDNIDLMAFMDNWLERR